MKILSVILISCLGTILYSNTFQCSFHLDDQFSIINNFAIRNITNPHDIWNFWPSRFITYLSLALNYYIDGFNVFGYHLFNLIVHLISAILVWWLVLLTLSTPTMKDTVADKRTGNITNILALLAGLLFVAHPIQTEAVTYIVQRAASMASLFYLASLCFYIKARLLQDTSVIANESKQSSKKIAASPAVAPKSPSRNNTSVFFYIISLLTAILAMFSKEMALTLPLMVLLYEFSFFRIKKSFNWGYSVPYLLIVIIIPLTIFWTGSGMTRIQALKTEPGISSFHYLLTQFRVLLTYLRLVFLPIHQNLDYDYSISKSLFDPRVSISLLPLIAILFAAVRLFSKYRLIAFSIFWFFLTLLPESSLIPIKDVIFEHRLYLPLVGYCIFLVSGLYYLWGKNNFKTMVIVLALIIAGYGLLTYQRNKVWKDELTLWGDTVQKSPHKARPLNNLGKAYLDRGEITQAMLDFDKAIEMDPTFALSYNNRGSVFTKQGDFTKALENYNMSIEHDTSSELSFNGRGYIYYKLDKLPEAKSDLNKAIEIDPHYSEAYNNLGCVYVKEGNIPQAIADFNKSIEMAADNERAYSNLGFIYGKEGRLTEAIADLNKSIEINPKYAESYNNLGTIYSNNGELTQALLYFNKAIQAEPDFTLSYINLGNIYSKQGDFAKALLYYNKAIEIDPQSALAYNGRGYIYCKQFNYTQAISDLNKAIEINPDYEEAYNNLGGLYADQNNFVQAILDFTKAIKLNPKNAQAYCNRGLVYGKEGNLTQAMSDLNKSIEINPKLAGAYSNLGFIDDNQGNFSQAILAFSKVIELNPDHAEGYYNRALTYYKQGDIARSIADFTKAIEMDPKRAEAYSNRGFVYSKEGSFTQALSDYNKAIELNPKMTTTYINRAVVYYHLKEFQNAWDDVHKVAEIGGVIDPQFLNELKNASVDSSLISTRT